MIAQACRKGHVELHKVCRAQGLRFSKFHVMGPKGGEADCPDSRARTGAYVVINYLIGKRPHGH